MIGNFLFYTTNHPIKQAVREAATICPRPCKLTFDLLTLKVVSKSPVTWATSVLILVFLGLCSRLRPDVRDRQTDVRRGLLLNAFALQGQGHNNMYMYIDLHDVS